MARPDASDAPQELIDHRRDHRSLFQGQEDPHRLLFDLQSLGLQNSQTPPFKAHLDRQDFASLVRHRRNTDDDGFKATTAFPFTSLRFFVLHIFLPTPLPSNSFPVYSPDSPHDLGANELLRAKSHLSAFTHLTSLTLAAVLFLSFHDASLEACFGSLAETVCDLSCRCVFWTIRGLLRS